MAYTQGTGSLGAARSATYRGTSREDAEREYHRAARVAAAEGYVPASEEWSTALGQQVLTVGYVYDPEQTAAVLGALTSIEATPPAASTAGPVLEAKPEPVAKSRRFGGGQLLIVVILVAGIALAAWASGLLGRVTSLGGSAGNIPPVGQIWFGASFDPSTFALSGSTSSIGTGSTVAMVAHLPRSVESGDVNIRLSLDGSVIANQNVTIKGSGELFGATVGPFTSGGSYLYELVDVGGNVLARGSLTVVGG